MTVTMREAEDQAMNLTRKAIRFQREGKLLIPQSYCLDINIQLHQGLSLTLTTAQKILIITQIGVLHLIMTGLSIEIMILDPMTILQEAVPTKAAVLNQPESTPNPLTMIALGR
jgi:hypothetical protein